MYMYFPKEVWQIIKNYMLGKEYWKEKMKLCFMNPNGTMWHPVFPSLKFKEGIRSLHCGIRLRRHYVTYHNIFKFTAIGIAYKGNSIRYEYWITNYDM